MAVSPARLGDLVPLERVGERDADGDTGAGDEGGERPGSIKLHQPRTSRLMPVGVFLGSCSSAGRRFSGHRSCAGWPRVVGLLSGLRVHPRWRGPCVAKRDRPTLGRREHRSSCAGGVSPLRFQRAAKGGQGVAFDLAAGGGVRSVAPGAGHPEAGLVVLVAARRHVRAGEVSALVTVVETVVHADDRAYRPSTGAGGHRREPRPTVWHSRAR